MMSVLTIGTFDLFHHGHLNLLQRASSLGDGLIVGINTDRFAASFKRTPMQTFEERDLMLRMLGYRTMSNDSPGRELIDAVRPAVVAVGSDWARKDYYAQIDVSQEWLEERGIILAYIPYTEDTSTSRLIERIRGGE